LPPKADMPPGRGDVGFVPKADIRDVSQFTNAKVITALSLGHHGLPVNRTFVAIRLECSE
jgi:hypothetical protein